MNKNYRFYVQGGGVFSRLLQCAIIPLANIDFNNVYLTAQKFPFNEYSNKWVVETLATEQLKLAEYGIKHAYDLLLNYVLDQQVDWTYDNGGVLPIGVSYNVSNHIEKDPSYYKFKKVLYKLKIKSHIVASADSVFKEYDQSKILGVHVRLKNISRHGLDLVTYDMYEQKIRAVLEQGQFDKIFVATDNQESLEKLDRTFPNMILYNKMTLPYSGDDDWSEWETVNYFKEFYWQEAVLDCLSLSKCHSLICRSSNFSNAAIVFANYKYIYRF